MSFKTQFDSTLQKVNFAHSIKILSSLLIIVILVGFLGGIIKTFIDLSLLIHDTVETGLRQMLLNVLNLLAVIEILKTGLSYLVDGRVRVTYIVDTVLIVMLNEVITFWFSNNHTGYMSLILILLTLIVVRILAIKYSPDGKG